MAGIAIKGYNNRQVATLSVAFYHSMLPLKNSMSAGQKSYKFIKRYIYRSKDQAIKSVEQAVLFYNERRPHTSLKYKTPAEVHKAAA